MKKSLYIVCAAALAMSVVSCVKEEFGMRQDVTKPVREFTVSFDSESSKTTLTPQGKTVWAEGDQIWITNGQECDTLTVGADFAGKKFFEFSTTLEDSIYVVYPITAQPKVDTVAHSISVVIPEVQDGTFGSANICCAIAADRMVKLRNVTSVLQFRIPNAAPKAIKAVSISGMGNAVTGTLGVTFVDGEPQVTASNEGNSIAVKTEGFTGKFYATVVPGTYNAGFSMTAVTTDLKHAVENKTTSEAKELHINDLYDLGDFGMNLQPVEGEGTEASPYLISNASELLALSYYVKEGNTMAGQYVKQTADIKGVTNMVGSYTSADVNAPFKGNYDGAGHVTTLSIMQKTNIPAGMFAFVADSAYIHDVVIDGTVSSTGNSVAALAGRIEANEAAVKVENITNRAAVSGNEQVAGVVGYATTPTGALLSFNNIKNEGAITAADATVGGVFGYLRASAGAVSVTKCANSGAVTSNRATAPATYFIFNTRLYSSGTSGTVWSGAGGIGGYILRSDLTDCENSGAVTAFMKVGGIAGMSMATYIGNSTNSGVITATGNAAYNIASQTGTDYGSAAGGIVGWLYSNGGVGEINTCTNTGKVLGRGNIAGIVGYSLNNGSKGYIKKCVNKGDVTAEKATYGGTWATICSGVGGVVGTLACHNSNYWTLVQDCKNEGAVSTDKAMAGGIAGRMYSGSNGGQNLINRCENYGSVTAQFYVGGITGMITCPYNQTATIRNCYNKGKVMANRETDLGDCAGGILGANAKTNSNTNYYPTSNIWNCYNEGEVVYAVADHAKPYTGGIVGRVNYKSNIGNVYSTGFVGPEGKGAPAEGAEKTLGALVGSHEVANSLSFAYWKPGVCAENIAATGSASVATGSFVTTFDETGKLAIEVTTPNNAVSTTLLDALNGWYNTAVTVWKQTYYYSWVAGEKAPVFLYPSYTDEFDGGNFDLGNGGEI